MKLFWAPSIQWREKNGKLKIGKFIFPEEFIVLFPELYFITQDGIECNQINECFSDFDEHRIMIFIKELIKRRVLIECINTPSELFFSQKKLYQHQYDEEYFLDPRNVLAFKHLQHNRTHQCSGSIKIDLELPSMLAEPISSRKTHRNFDHKVIDFQTFSTLISVFMQREGDEVEPIRYYYPSAGGLNPIDVFIHIKEGRVEHVTEGIYYYSPITHHLEIVKDNITITDEAHYSINKEIFNASAFSVYFIYNGKASIPKYGGLGYFYACIDTGIMVATFNLQCQQLGVGVCSVGDMNFNKIAQGFSLENHQVLIHNIECGLIL